MRSFKIRGERLLTAIDWMTRVERDVQRARPLAVRFQMYVVLKRISAKHLWPDACDLLRRNPAFLSAELELGGLLERLEKVCHPSVFRAFMAFLSAVACGEVTERDLQT